MDSAFGKSLFGYKKEEVESSIQQMEKENLQKIKKLEEELDSTRAKLRTSEKSRTELQQKLDELNKKESAMVDLLLAAREKAERIEMESQTKADQIMQDIDAEYFRKHDAIEELRTRYSDFRNNFRGLLDRYTSMISQMPELVFADESQDQSLQNDTEYQDEVAGGTLVGGWGAETQQTQTRPLATGFDEERTPDSDISNEPDIDSTDEFTKPKSSLDRLLSKATFEEPEAEAEDQLEYKAAKTEVGAEAVPGPMVDSAPSTEDQGPESPILAVTAVEESPADEEKTAELAPLPADAASEPVIDRKYKPFTPFAKTAVLADETLLEEVPEESATRAVFQDELNKTREVPKETVVLESEAHVEKVQDVINETMEKPEAAPDKVAELNAEEPYVQVASAQILDFPWMTPASTPVEPEKKPEPVPENTSRKLGESYGKSWEGDNSKGDQPQPSPESIKLKELLERHRAEIASKNQSRDVPPETTIHLDMSEEDKKFWS